MCSSDAFLGFIAIIFPPLAVWVKTGICSADSLINLCLCMLGFVPGLLHAWYIIAKYPDRGSEYDSLAQQDPEAGRVAYVVVQPNGHRTRVPKPSNVAGQGGRVGPQSYGTVGATPNVAPAAPQVYQNEDGTWGNGEGGSSGGVPPSYAEAVKADNKIQTKD